MRVYGHYARIWQVKFSHADTSFFSAGEDGRFIHWNLYGDILNTYESNIPREGFWGISRCNDNSVLISCHSGQVVKLDYNPSKFGENEFSIPGEKIKSIEILHDGTVFMMTEIGNLWALLHNHGSPNLIFSDTRFESYCYLCINESGTLGCVGNVKGEAKIFDPRIGNTCEIFIKPHDRKIVFMCFKSHEITENCYLFTSDQEGCLKVHELSLNDGLKVNFEISILDTFDHSCISALDTQITDSYLSIATGDEKGTVRILNLRSNKIWVNKFNLKYVCMIPWPSISISNCNAEGVIVNGNFSLIR
ncbi:hypothetical protein RF11_04487 [Thelohanellus kitauei]|uniref:tRNA (34-2'-O)-methyltransferase regulator WDR6 n=1 Tax=Thelohanellus kitauei TaxID=669202 RepID=A0A0C2IGK1_THEKT|nr:hypothetical protein RF11_04487 [Thelohanellus kitauei]